MNLFFHQSTVYLHHYFLECVIQTSRFNGKGKSLIICWWMRKFVVKGIYSMQKKNRQIHKSFNGSYQERKRACECTNTYKYMYIINVYILYIHLLYPEWNCRVYHMYAICALKNLLRKYNIIDCNDIVLYFEMLTLHHYMNVVRAYFVQVSIKNIHHHLRVKAIQSLFVYLL